MYAPPWEAEGADFDINTKSGKLRKIVLNLLREHERAGEDGLPTSARFLFYELVQRSVLKKHDGAKTGGRRADQDLHVALTFLREHGYVPWEWITDETRSISDYTGFVNVKTGVPVGNLIRLVREAESRNASVS